MVLDSDRRLGPGTVTALDMAGNHILRRWSHSKKQMTADFAALNTTVCEHIDLFSRCCRLVSFTLVFIVTPGQGFGTSLLNSSDKVDARPPSFATEKHNLLRGSRSTV